MDRKAIIVLTVSFLLLIAWFPLVNRLYPPAPVRGTNRVDMATGQTSSVPAVAIQGEPGKDAAKPKAGAPDSGPEPDVGPEQLLVLENAQGRYTFTSHGGGLKLVELKNYPAAVICGEDARTNAHLAKLNARAAMPVLGLIAPGTDGGDKGYTLSSNSPASVRATRRLRDGLVIVKEFTLGSDYVVKASLTFSNSTGETLSIPQHDVVVGTAAPAGPKDDPTMMGLFVFDGKDDDHVPASWFDNRAFGCSSAHPREKYESGKESVVWAAAHNQFFALAAIPKEPASGLVSRRAPLLPPETNHVGVTNGKADATTHGFENAFVYRGAVLQPHTALAREFDFYAGPKELQTLAKLGAQYGNDLDLIMDLDGFFGFFSKLLLLAMNTLHGWGVSYGWAIVAITVFIKLAFWPLTNASTKSMKRMAAIQPQMKELQEKYKDNPQKMNQKMMELWKEHKINPLGGCLPMLIQMPVFFGFFFMIRTAIELRGAEFLWICDLSTADTVTSLFGFPINPMAILMGATMLVQMRMTPVSPGMDPMQAKMMKYMPLMFLVFLYNFSSGLTLYWTVQNVLSIVQMKVTKADKPAAPAAKPAPQPAIATSSKKKKRK